jgi:pimeloyl-ACP methyl ester carboxylesterase
VRSRRNLPPPPRARNARFGKRRRRGGRRLLGLLGVAALGAGLVYLARRDAEQDELLPPEPPSTQPPPDAEGEAAEAGRFVDVATGRLFVRVSGDSGPALLLLHGLGGSGTHWQPQLAALGGSCRVVAPDLRGHGRSESKGDAAFDVAAHAADVLALADALGLDRFAIAGHSFGAWVALEVAAMQPDRVLALALVDPGGDTSGEPPAAVDAALGAVRDDPRREFTQHYREFLHGARPATARRVLADLAATGVDVLVTGITEAMRYPARARLAAYAGPVLCIAGPLNDVPGSLTRTVPDLATEWLAPTSHWLMLDRPEQTSGLLADLVQSAASASR